MRAFLTRATILAAMAIPAACATSHTDPPAPRTAPPVVFGMGYTWEQTSEPEAGVRVRVHRPVPRLLTEPSVAPSAGWIAMTRELVVKIEVFNDSRGAVRIGIAGYEGKYEAIPKVVEDPFAIPAKSTGAVHRTLFVPAGDSPIVVHVAATVDGRPLRNGWRYVGPATT